MPTLCIVGKLDLQFEPPQLMYSLFEVFFSRTKRKHHQYNKAQFIVKFNQTNKTPSGYQKQYLNLNYL